jgi:hypothetical protein
MPAQVPGTPVEVISGDREWNGELAAKRPSSSTTETVDVINGSERQTRVFNEENPVVMPQAAGGQRKAAKRLAQERTETTPQIPVVEVINGAQLETRRFEGAEDEIATPWIERRSSRPVVIGVATVGPASGRGNTARATTTAPIVIGVASSESERHGENAKPVAYRIVPGPPKRPPYNPTVPPGY